MAGKDLAEVEADMARAAKSRVGGRPSMLQAVMKGRGGITLPHKSTPRSSAS